MPLAGSGAAAGLVILSAIGNPDPAAIPVFGGMMNALATWSVANMACLAGTMVSAGAAVTGFGKLACLGNRDALGPLLAAAVKDPSAGGIATWTKFGRALIQHFETFGQVNPATFVAPTPSGGTLTGVGKIQFANMVVTPFIPAAIGVTESVAAAMLTLFGTTILAQIALNAVVVPIAISAPFLPYTAAPGGGPITGAGSMT